MSRFELEEEEPVIRCRYCRAKPGERHGPFCDGPDGEPRRDVAAAIRACFEITPAGRAALADKPIEAPRAEERT